jgi:hypothetical protein
VHEPALVLRVRMHVRNLRLVSNLITGSFPSMVSELLSLQSVRALFRLNARISALTLFVLQSKRGLACKMVMEGVPQRMHARGGGFDM